MINDVIIGGGVSGLIAAYQLLKKGRKVILLEKSDKVGGALSSFKIKNYWIEEFYHHVFPNDNEFLSLLDELGLKHELDWIYAFSSFYVGDKFYRFTSQLDVLGYTPLSIIEKIRLGFSVLKLQRSKNLDSITAEQWLMKNAGLSVYNKFYKPMLVGKFGKFYNKVSAGWFADRVKLRGKGGLKGEKLGYMRFGFNRFVEVLEKAIISKGGKIIKNTNIKKIVIDESNNAKQLYYNNNKIDVNSIISTIPLKDLNNLIKLDRKYLDFQYQGSICVIIGLNKQVSNYYWTNIYRDKNSFAAMIEHTNFKSPDNYSGDHIVYLASYPDNDSKIWGMSDKQVFDLYFSDLKKIVSISNQDVLWYKISRLPNAGLVYTTGVMKKLMEIGNKTNINNIFVGSMFNTWPERSINSSVKKGRECAELVFNV